MPKRGALSMTMRRSLLAVVAGEQHMQRRARRQRRAVGRDVVHLAVGEHDDRADALGRHVGKRCRQRAEQFGAVDRLAAGRRRRPRCVRTSMPRNSARRAVSASAASAVVLSRSSRFWLALLSTTTATTVDSGSRSSLRSTGLASASSSATAAAARNQAPRMRRQTPGASSSAATTREARSASGHGSSGEKTTRPVHRVYCPSRSSSAGTCT